MVCLNSDADQFILPAPKADFFGMIKSGFPLCIGMVQVVARGRPLGDPLLF